MSTRCNIRIFDSWNKTKPGAMLYHHSDGYPRFMKGKLERFLAEAFQVLQDAGYTYWWDSERVAALLVMLSIEDYVEPLLPYSTDRGNRCDGPTKPYRPNQGVPVFQPCQNLHGDIEYIWNIYLHEDEGIYTMTCRTEKGRRVPEGNGGNGKTREEPVPRVRRKRARNSVLLPGF